MSFTFPSLIYIWLLPLVALPVLIHLINLLRHRRVPWAAMEFLLESKKKNQNWIRLKQLLLLLCRMAAIALIVFLLAGPLLQDKWSTLFGGGKTHHVVLLDDSGSMADQGPGAGGTAFDRARDVVASIVSRSRAQTSQHWLSLLRFSDAAAGKPPELVRQPITAEFEVEFSGDKTKLTATQLSVGPLKTLEAIESALQPEEDENLVVYVVSDLRTAQWQDALALKQVLARLNDMNAQLQLVHCVDQSHGNLAITHLAPTPGQQATGVLIRMEVEVTNFDAKTAGKRQVQLQQRVFSGPTDQDGEITALGAVTFDRIDPGRSTRRTFDVMFSSAGQHEVVARLPSDPIAADNERFSIVEVVPDVPILIIDGGGGDNPLFLRLALAPSPKTRTGLKPQIESPSFLREQPLADFHTIYLVNVDRLDESAVEALETYVRDGGGVVFYAGDAARRDFINNSLYRDGEGLFPLPLAAPANLLVDRLEKAPDMAVDYDHPIFRRTFADKYNTWLQKILVERYFAAPKEWKAEDDNQVAVVARLRNGAPLMVEKKFGKGRVLAVLTTAAPVWHNWGLANPTFIVGTLETQVYMGGQKVASPVQQVGQPLQLAWSDEEYLPEAELVVPSESGPRVIQASAKAAADDPSRLALAFADTGRSGVYAARLRRLDGTGKTRRFAYNMSATESDLATISQAELQSTLGEDISFQYRQAAEFLAPVRQQAGFPLAEQWWFFLALVLLLIIEQLLAYSATYHPPLTGVDRR